MAKLTIHALGRKLLETRGERGVREVAHEIGISAATLSRMERGHVPDLNTFGKVCRWLHIDAGEVLGLESQETHTRPMAMVHFRKDHAINPQTAQALAQLILAAQRALVLSESEKRTAG
jgi:transcriptional regulator with XRE-family HTH domain